MDIQKLLISTVLGALTIFVAGFLIFALILPNIGFPPPVEAPGFREGGVLWAGIVSNLAWAGLLSYIFIQWASISTVNTGMKAGALIGLIIGIAVSMSFFNATTIFGTPIFFIGPIAVAIEMGLAGAVIGWWLGRGASTS